MTAGSCFFVAKATLRWAFFGGYLEYFLAFALAKCFRGGLGKPMFCLIHPPPSPPHSLSSLPPSPCPPPPQGLIRRFAPLSALLAGHLATLRSTLRTVLRSCLKAGFIPDPNCLVVSQRCAGCLVLFWLCRSASRFRHRFSGDPGPIGQTGKAGNLVKSVEGWKKRIPPPWL